jgi:anti-anti-sigma factor
MYPEACPAVERGYTVSRALRFLPALNMDINKTQTPDKTTFALSGRLDSLTAPQLEEMLIPEFDNAKHVELDFAELVFMSSAGLRTLIQGAKTAKTKGVQMTIVHVSSVIREVFEMTGCMDILRVG